MSRPIAPYEGSRARRFLLPVLSLCVGTSLALAMAEGAFRGLALRAPEVGRIFRISNGADIHFPGRAGHVVIDLYRSNPRQSFPVDLNLEETRLRLTREKFTRIDEARTTNPYGVPFTYNSRGFRDREFTAKLGNVRRVVFVGDSFTEALGVVQDATAARRTEALLKRNDPKVETWNLGVRALDFPDLERIFDAAFELSPDAIIYGMVLNDGDRDEALAKRWPRLNDWIMVRQEKPSWLERHSYAFSYLSYRLEAWEVSRDTTAWYRSIYSDENRAGWMRTRAAWLRIEAKCRAQGISFGVALWPLLVGLEREGAYPFETVHTQIRRGVERSHLEFMDLLPALRGHDPPSLWVHPSDLHPNEIAQTLVAPALAEFARRLLGKPISLGSVAK